MVRPKLKMVPCSSDDCEEEAKNNGSGRPLCRKCQQKVAAARYRRRKKINESHPEDSGLKKIVESWTEHFDDKELLLYVDKLCLDIHNAQSSEKSVSLSPTVRLSLKLLLLFDDKNISRKERAIKFNELKKEFSEQLKKEKQSQSA
jgi:hypothetical protein